MTCHVNDRLLTGPTCFDFGLIACMYNGDGVGKKKVLNRRFAFINVSLRR